MRQVCHKPSGYENLLDEAELLFPPHFKVLPEGRLGPFSALAGTPPEATSSMNLADPRESPRTDAGRVVSEADVITLSAGTHVILNTSDLGTCNVGASAGGNVWWNVRT